MQKNENEIFFPILIDRPFRMMMNRILKIEKKIIIIIEFQIILSGSFLLMVSY